MALLSSIFIDYYDFKLTRDDLVFIKKLARVSNIETACDVSSEKSKEIYELAKETFKDDKITIKQDLNGLDRVLIIEKY